MRNNGSIHIGTSGWNYEHWKGPFYPRKISAGEMLAYYKDHFGTVEINSSFYHLPTEKSVMRWRDTVPVDFIFAAKGSRYITHMKKLKGVGDAVDTLLRVIGLLGDKQGPVLFQLPPRWGPDLPRLREFLRLLPGERQFAFEFRDPGWLVEEVYGMLSEFHVAFCVYDFNWRLSPLVVTSDVVYIRLHGPDGAYAGSYSDGFLSEWAGKLLAWAEGGRDVYCYFDNDQMGYAAKNALSLRRMVEGVSGAARRAAG